MGVQQSATASRAMSFLSALPSQDASPHCPDSVQCQHLCCRLLKASWKATRGKQASSLLQHTSACKSVFIISQTYAAAKYSSSVWEPERHYPFPRGGKCFWQPCGGLTLAIFEFYASAACVWFGCPCFFQGKYINILLKILIMILIVAGTTLECTMGKRGWEFLQQSKDIDPIAKRITW